MSTPSSREAGELRQLTIMFCDLVDSSSLAGRLDPEDLRDVIRSYHEAAARVIREFKGHVAQYLGDGVLAYFDYPEAHEDEAERAVRAGRLILAEIGEINPRLERSHGVHLQARIGIHTGGVALGAFGDSESERLALGYSVNFAERIQRAAPPDSVVISEATLRLVRGLFITENLGTRELPGIAEAVPVHRVLRGSGVRSRLDVAIAAGLTPLVGREQDLADILEHWDHVCEGRGRVVLVRGEPGIGKSRLVHALREQLAEERHSWLECRGSPHLENSALHPVIELLRQGLQLQPGQTAEEKIRRLERAMDLAGLRLSEVVPLFAALLSIPLPERYPRPTLTPEVQRQRTLDALATWLFGLARQQPAVLVFEDLHWSDPSSLELLDLLIQRGVQTPLLLIATYRPVFEPSWSPGPGVAFEELRPLTRRQTTAMLESLTGDATLPPTVREQIVSRTDGVPLFVEELTKSVLESGVLERTETEGAAAAPELVIPATLQDSLEARLDRLGPAKDLAQLAAVVGHHFSHELLAAVADTGEEDLRAGLAQLEGAGLVYRSGEPPEASYRFKHALVQETAYHSLFRSTRRARHERIARVLEKQFPDSVAARPELLARHCEHGGLTEEAISLYRRAAELARDRSANAEAIAHLGRAIGLLGKLTEGRHRDEDELMLQVDLGTSLMTVHGWGSPEGERAYARARELCEGLEHAPQQFQALRGLVTFYVSRSELDTAHALAGQLLRLAENGGDPASQLLAHQQMAIVLYYQGDSPGALVHYERALALFQPADHGALRSVYGEDMGVFIRIWMAWALWTVGRADRASAACEQALERAEAVDHPFSIACALLWSAMLHVLALERGPARDAATRAVDFAEEHGFAFLQALGRLTRVWAEYEPHSDAADGARTIAAYRAALDEWSRATHTLSGLPMALGHLADTCRGVGRYGEALEATDGGLEFSARTGQCFWDAELHRVRGETLIARDGDASPEAERDLERALEVARSQQARSLELRAALSLCRLWQRQRRTEQARALLAPLYDSFEEGLEAPDLRDARSLLAELS